MFSSRPTASPEKNNVLLQKAKFFLFILKNLASEERFTGSDLFKAFLPASKSASSYYNSKLHSMKEPGAKMAFRLQ